jgi:hypothetical protein
MGDDRQYATATLRNRDFILDVLRDVLPMTGVIREVASASGEHVVHFARNFPTLVFQPSDPEPNPRLSVAAWVKAAGVTNVRAPIALDASNLVWPIASADGIICINMVHISPWEATLDQGRRRSTSTVHTNAKSSQRPLATNHSIGSLAGDRSDWRHLGGFKWSSQHLDGSCDEHSKTALGSFWAGAVVLTRSTACGRARGAAAILGSDCGGHGE